MAETVRIPGIKEPLPKWGVYAGVGATGLLIVVYYRNRKNQAAAAAAAPDGTGLASGGLAAGSGLLAGDTSGGAYPWDGTYGDPSDPFSLDTSTGQTYGTEGFTGQQIPPGGGVAGPPFSSNAAWSAYAIQQLTQVSGMDASSVTEALGRYLEGQELTTAQQDIVYAAEGVAGSVPVASASGYPPKLRSSSGGGKPKGGKTFAHNPVTGLTVRPGDRSVTVSWDKAADATGYQVSLANLTAHRNAGGPVTTAHTTFTFRGLTAGDRFEATVLAKPAEKGARPAKIQAAPIALLPQARR